MLGYNNLDIITRYSRRKKKKKGKKKKKRWKELENDTALISTIVHKLARSKCCQAVGKPLISAIQERNERERERGREGGIDRVVKDRRKKIMGGGGGIKRRKSRYVSSRYVFIRRVKLSRGFYVFIYLSLHSPHDSPRTCIEQEAVCMPLHAACGPCQGLADWKSRSPLTPSFRRLVPFFSNSVSRQPV